MGYEVAVDLPGEVWWFKSDPEEGDRRPVGSCPHTGCRHTGQSVVAWGPDLDHYELIVCDDDNPGGLRRVVSRVAGGGRQRQWWLLRPQGSPWTDVPADGRSVVVQATSGPPAPATMTALLTRWRTCRCGHPATWHQHYRPGRDCSGCGCERSKRGGTPVPLDYGQPPVLGPGQVYRCRDGRVLYGTAAGPVDMRDVRCDSSGRLLGTSPRRARRLPRWVDRAAAWVIKGPVDW
jgi:hypothetical protein